MKKFLGIASLVVLVGIGVFSLIGATPVWAGEALEAGAVFDQLKALEGTWQGKPQGEGAAAESEEQPPAEVTHVFQVSAAGTVVMETMMPGTDHEMINMYHLDGDDLVLTHYCAGGNQPQMRLNRETSTADTLNFDFAGGTNLNPATDGHIHSGQLVLKGGDRIDSVWLGYNEGKPAGKMTFHLARSK